MTLSENSMTSWTVLDGNKASASKLTKANQNTARKARPETNGNMGVCMMLSLWWNRVGADHVRHHIVIALAVYRYAAHGLCFADFV